LNFSKIDWQTDYLAVIDRVIECGNKDQWKEKFQYYGESKMIKALKPEIKYLTDYAIDDVGGYFKIKRGACMLHTSAVEARHWI